jgi:hypothetical protein
VNPDWQPIAETKRKLSGIRIQDSTIDVIQTDALLTSEWVSGQDAIDAVRRNTGEVQGRANLENSEEATGEEKRSDDQPNST